MKCGEGDRRTVGQSVQDPIRAFVKQSADGLQPLRKRIKGRRGERFGSLDRRIDIADGVAGDALMPNGGPKR